MSQKSKRAQKRQDKIATEILLLLYKKARSQEEIDEILDVIKGVRMDGIDALIDVAKWHG